MLHGAQKSSKEYGYFQPYQEQLTLLNPGSHFFYVQKTCGFTVPFVPDFLAHGILAQMHNMAHLCDQKYPGQLSHMVVQDGNHQILGVTWNGSQTEL